MMVVGGHRISISRHASRVMAGVGGLILGAALLLSTALRPSPGPVETAPESTLAVSGTAEAPPPDDGIIEQIEGR